MMIEYDDKFEMELYSHDVRDICTNMHDHVSGICGWCGKDYMQNCVNWLQLKLDNWEDRTQHQEYDAIIKSLIIVCIKEGNEYIEFFNKMEAEGKHLV